MEELNPDEELPQPEKKATKELKKLRGQGGIKKTQHRSTPALITSCSIYWGLNFLKNVKKVSIMEISIWFRRPH